MVDYTVHCTGGQRLRDAETEEMIESMQTKLVELEQENGMLKNKVMLLKNIPCELIFYTVNGERFTGLNFRGFHPIKFFTGKLLRCFMFKALKQCYYKKLAIRETFVVLLRIVKNTKV